MWLGNLLEGRKKIMFVLNSWTGADCAQEGCFYFRHFVIQFICSPVQYLEILSQIPRDRLYEVKKSRLLFFFNPEELKFIIFWEQSLSHFIKASSKFNSRNWTSVGILCLMRSLQAAVRMMCWAIQSQSVMQIEEIQGRRISELPKWQHWHLPRRSWNTLSSTWQRKYSCNPWGKSEPKTTVLVFSYVL